MASLVGSRVERKEDKRLLTGKGRYTADINGSKVTTIEGLVKDGKMHPMQDAFKKMHGLQCGFCTPGMVMSAIDLLQNKKNPSDIEIREWLEGNICRCTGYQNIVAAVKEAASKM
jgi:carbon-monoxide dehydrogenase small subunit